jgi:ABC-type transporter Mla MlaB component
MTPHHCLPAELTIYTVGELRPRWLSWLAEAHGDGHGAEMSGEAFVVDAAAVGEVDAAGMQLLLSLSKSMDREHRVLKLHSASRALAAACAALGASALLADTCVDGANP